MREGHREKPGQNGYRPFAGPRHEHTYAPTEPVCPHSLIDHRAGCHAMPGRGPYRVVLGEKEQGTDDDR